MIDSYCVFFRCASSYMMASSVLLRTRTYQGLMLKADDA
jgi:hypothetical protein